MKADEMMARVLPRLAKFPDSAGISFIEALNTVVDLFFERLHRQRSSVVLQPFDYTDIWEEVNELPEDFRGLASARLRLVGTKTIDIEEFPADGDADIEGDPRWFRLVGPRSIEIIPAPTESYELKGMYYSHPGTLTISSTIPWGGLFDTAIADAIVMVSEAGSIEAAIRTMRESIDTLIDGVVVGRTVSPRRNKLW